MNDTTASKSAMTSSFTTMSAAAFARSIRLLIPIEPEVSMTITTYHGRTRGS